MCHSGAQRRADAFYVFRVYHARITTTFHIRACMRVHFIRVCVCVYCVATLLLQHYANAHFALQMYDILVKIIPTTATATTDAYDVYLHKLCMTPPTPLHCTLFIHARIVMQTVSARIVIVIIHGGGGHNATRTNVSPQTCYYISYANTHTHICECGGYEAVTEQLNDSIVSLICVS